MSGGKKEGVKLPEERVCLLSALIKTAAAAIRMMEIDPAEAPDGAAPDPFEEEQKRQAGRDGAPPADPGTVKVS